MQTGSTWDSWDTWNSWFLEQPLKEPERYSGRARCDYECKTVHIIQIGLGTFGTLLDTDMYWMEMLLEASSRTDGDDLKGIGVDPVEESVGPLEQLAVDQGQRHISIILAAVGEEPDRKKIGDDETCQVSLCCLPRNARMEMRREQEDMPKDMRAFVDKQLAYLETCKVLTHPPRTFYIKSVRYVSGRGQNRPCWSSVKCHYIRFSAFFSIIIANVVKCSS